MRVRGGVSPREWEYHFVPLEIPGYETEKTTSDKHQRAISKTPSDSNTGPDDYVIGPHANMHEYRHVWTDPKS